MSNVKHIQDHSEALLYLNIKLLSVDTNESICLLGEIIGVLVLVPKAVTNILEVVS